MKILRAEGLVGGRFSIGLVGVERRGRWFAKYYISVDYKNKSFAFAVITERGISTGETGIHPTILNRFTTGGKQPNNQRTGGQEIYNISQKKMDQVKRTKLE